MAPTTRSARAGRQGTLLLPLLLMVFCAGAAPGALAARGRGAKLQLGSRCNSDHNCLASVQHSRCVQGHCSCQPYFAKYNATRCLPSSLLGFPCLVREQCSLKVANSSCIQGQCRCEQGFLQFRRHTCLTPARPTQVCYSDSHCRLWDPDTHCDFLIPKLFGRCRCNAPLRQLGEACLKEGEEGEGPPPPPPATETSGSTPAPPPAVTGEFDNNVPQGPVEDGAHGPLSSDSDNSVAEIAQRPSTIAFAISSERVSSTTSSPSTASPEHASATSTTTSTSALPHSDLGPSPSQEQTPTEPQGVNALPIPDVSTSTSQPPLDGTMHQKPGVSANRPEVSTTHHQDETAPLNPAIPPPEHNDVSPPSPDVSLSTQLLWASPEGLRPVPVSTGDASADAALPPADATQPPAKNEDEDEEEGEEDAGDGEGNASPSHANAGAIPLNVPLVASPSPATSSTPSPTEIPSRRAEDASSAPVASAPAPAPAPAPAQPVSLGQSCSSDAQCAAADPHSRCALGVCDCALRNGTCNAQRTGCHAGTFQCESSGACISWYFVCDGRRDCADGSDERCRPPAHSAHSGAPLRCPALSFRCPPAAGGRGAGRCVSRAALCDGKRDCAGGEDEAGCSRDAHKCPEHTFRCGDGTCLPAYEYCNAVVSCPDASDEPRAACKGKGPANGGRRSLFCPLRCANGRCRSTAVACSGRDGCGDHSDETRCHVCKCPAVH